MSRDWCPRELYFADKHMAAQGYSMRDSDFMFVNTATGEKIPLKSEEEKTIGKNFPNLSFLLDGWYRVYSSMTNTEARDNLFKLYENTLSAIIVEDEDVSFAVPHTIFEYDTIIKWYCGKLDKGFYYNERNNELLFENMWANYKKFCEE